ncbi:MAG: M42 family metallopeptidase [Clostridia bacterium]|nr:M42 family metallopeptidase [Clostridia bacterium]
MDNLSLLLKKLCELNGPSGNENAVRDFILSEIAPYCDAKVDQMGNIIAFKKGDEAPKYKVMLDAHMDEVGVIVNGITADGFIKFETVGGIETEALIAKKVRFGNIVGVIGAKPVHQSSPDERKKLPSIDSLYIDIGANSKEDAENFIGLGDIGTFESEWADLSDDIFRSKAVDDRVGCAVLINLLKAPAKYDFYATFTIGEEIGLRGARTATYSVDPDFAIALECTTAADIGKNTENPVTKVGEGVAVSFMDRATLYDRELYDFAIKTASEKGIPLQIKTAVSGGNNAGAIHLTKGGVRTITLSLPGRYIHSSGVVGSKSDLFAEHDLAKALLNAFASGSLD